VKRAYRRVLLKLSGEALGGRAGEVVDAGTCGWLATEIGALHRHGVQFAVVIGGGNLYRGARNSDAALDRTTADTVGMLATVMNSLLFQSHLEAAGVPAVTMSANAIEKATETYSPRAGRRHLESGRVVLVAGGTGNPFFTTDTAAALRCAELQGEVLLKATKVDGVYDRDPAVHRRAAKLARLTYADALERRLRVMDATAFSFCMEYAIPIVVFKLARGNLRQCIEGRPIGSIITGGA